MELHPNKLPQAGSIVEPKTQSLRTPTLLGSLGQEHSIPITVAHLWDCKAGWTLESLVLPSMQLITSHHFENASFLPYSSLKILI